MPLCSLSPGMPLGEKETLMSKSDARAVLLIAQRDGSHPRLSEALSVLGLPNTLFDRLMKAAKGVEGRRCGLEILTPSGHGTRTK